MNLYRSSAILLSASLTSSLLLADTVSLKNGRQLTGHVDAADVRELRLKTADGVQTIAVSDIQLLVFDLTPAPQAAAPVVLIPEGTRIAIMTIDAIDSQRADVNREYSASLADPLAVDGVTIAEKGARAFLRVEEIKESGRVKGRAELTLSLAAVVVSGQRVMVQSGEVVSTSGSQGARTAKSAAAVGALGAIIGGIAGGGKGAVIGATAGTATGVGLASLNGQRVRVPSETRLTFTLSQAARVAAPK